MWYLRSLERDGVIQKLTILERKNGLVLSNTRVPVSGTWSILFPNGKNYFVFANNACFDQYYETVLALGDIGACRLATRERR